MIVPLGFTSGQEAGDDMCEGLCIQVGTQKRELSLLPFSPVTDVQPSPLLLFGFLSGAF